MPILYRPLRQYMTPQNQAVSPTANSKFSLFISGNQCIAYKFSIYDLLNTKITAISTNKVALSPTLYDGDELEISVDLSTGVVAGNDYKWQVVLYGSNLTVSAIDTSAETLTVTNHNLVDGDMIYIQSSSTLPSPLTAFTTYYIRKIASDKIELHTTYESARNDGTPVNLTGSLAGTTTISPITISEQIPFSVYATPTLTLTTETIAKYYKEFVPVYSHTQGLQPIKFLAELYNEIGILLDSSGEVYNSNVKYTFSGLLPDRSYGVKFTVWNKLNQVADTGIVLFPVSYSTATLTTTPIAINNSEDSSIDLELNRLYQIIGVSDPSDGYDYVPYYNLFNDDTGLHLDIDYDNVITNSTFTDTTGWTQALSFAYQEITAANNKLKVRKTDATSGVRQNFGTQYTYNLIDEHEYYIRYTINTSSAATMQHSCYFSSSTTSVADQLFVTPLVALENGTTTTFSAKVIASNSQKCLVFYMYGGANTTDYFELASPEIIDLTASDNSKTELTFSNLDILPESTLTFEWMPDNYLLFDGDIIKLENTYNANEYVTIGYDNSLSKFYRKVNNETKFYSPQKILEDNQIYLLALTPNELIVVDFYNYNYGYLEDYPRYRTLQYDSGIDYIEDI